MGVVSLPLFLPDAITISKPGQEEEEEKAPCDIEEKEVSWRPRPY